MATHDAMVLVLTQRCGDILAAGIPPRPCLSGKGCSSVQVTLLRLRLQLPLLLHLVAGASCLIGAGDGATMTATMVMRTGAIIMMTAMAGVAGTAAGAATMKVITMVGPRVYSCIQQCCTSYSWVV